MPALFGQQREGPHSCLFEQSNNGSDNVTMSAKMSLKGDTPLLHSCPPQKLKLYEANWFCSTIRFHQQETPEYLLNMSDQTIPQLAEPIMTYDEYRDAYPTAVLTGDVLLNTEYRRYFDRIAHTDELSTPDRQRHVIELLDELAGIFESSTFTQFGSRSAHPPEIFWNFDIPAAIAAYRNYIWQEAQQDGYLTIVRDHVVQAVEAILTGQRQDASDFAPTTERPATEDEACEPCSVCLNNPALGDMLTVLPCVGHAGHWFHTACIEEWFERSRKRTCPLRCAQHPAN